VRLILTSVLFAIWAVVWMALAFMTFAVVTGFGRIGASSLGVIPVWVMTFAGPTFVVAAGTWAVIHRKGCRPRLRTYAVVALLVVLMIHLLTLAVMRLPAHESGGLVSWLVIAGTSLMFHIWVTLPIALLATGLFVWMERLPSTTRPSAPSPARSGS
jgi:hypothetical protein